MLPAVGKNAPMSANTPHPAHDNLRNADHIADVDFGPALAGPVPACYTDLMKHCYDSATLGAVGALVGWDQETYMPPAGGANRADQQALLSGLLHERRTSKMAGDLIAACEQDPAIKADPMSAAAANIRELRRDFDLATKLPTELVSALAKATSLAQDVWKLAREKNDFAGFAPQLSEVMNLTRRKAECYGVPSFTDNGKARKGELYDALLDEYEPGMSAAEIQTIFTPLQARLSALVAEICNGSTKLNTQKAEISAPQTQQAAFAREVLATMGFDLGAGRLDTTTHPFCSGIGPGDTRLTTRYTSANFLEPLSSTMHEAGHGLYEQGLPKGSRFGQPLADAVSLGIHESQSRMWENFVGRSRAFCSWLLPVAQRHFGPSTAALTADDLFAAANVVERSFIRVEADEATYNLHVMLRFGLERGLISGDLAIKDLPGEWNKRFKELFGLDVPDDKRGCLQDVHWSFGLVGYFPTYTLGNIYAAQMWETINASIPDLHARMARGDFAPLLAFLRASVHQHGRRFTAKQLGERITGKPLSADALMRHLEGKLRPLYRL